MDGFKILIDLEMPMPTPHKEEEGECDFDECDACGMKHDPIDDCPDNDRNFRNGPIPELVNDEPVVPSEYLKRIKAAEKVERKAKRKGK